MWPAISGSAFSDAPTAPQQIRRAAEAGFRGVELHIAGATSRDDFVGRFRPAEIRELASEQDVRIASLSVNSGVNLASDDPEALPRAAEWLNCAAAIGAERLIFPPVASLSAHEPQQRIAYADAYARTLDALMRLRHDAEARGVTLAVDTGDEAFLTSPLEAARLLDEVNSPAVGWRLDDRVVPRIGHLRDWIETLGGMISCVRLGESVARVTKPDTPQSAASLDEIIVALQEFAYDGPLIVADGADPREMFATIDRAIRDALAKE